MQDLLQVYQKQNAKAVKLSSSVLEEQESVLDIEDLKKAAQEIL